MNNFSINKSSIFFGLSIICFTGLVTIFEERIIGKKYSFKTSTPIFVRDDIINIAYSEPDCYINEFELKFILNSSENFLVKVDINDTKYDEDAEYIIGRGNNFDHIIYLYYKIYGNDLFTMDEDGDKKYDIDDVYKMCNTTEYILK